jgi:hypothetical protein
MAIGIGLTLMRECQLTQLITAKNADARLTFSSELRHLLQAAELLVFFIACLLVGTS